MNDTTTPTPPRSDASDIAIRALASEAEKALRGIATLLGDGVTSIVCDVTPGRNVTAWWVHRGPAEIGHSYDGPVEADADSRRPA